MMVLMREWGMGRTMEPYFKEELRYDLGNPTSR